MAERLPRPLLVGESNPYGGDPRFALWPDPPRCAGWRLCHLVMRLTERQYLLAYDRVNLCAGPWRIAEARSTATHLCAGDAQPPVIVLCGSKVCGAFDVTFDPFTFNLATRVVILPHPSGLSRAWNEPGALQRARAVLASAGCEVGA
jgi:hypothetical protein